MLYDLLQRGGRVIDLAQNLDGALDVAVKQVLPGLIARRAKGEVTGDDVNR